MDFIFANVHSHAHCTLYTLDWIPSKVSHALYLYSTILDSATYNYYYVLKFKIWIADDFVPVIRITCMLMSRLGASIATL